MEVPLGRLADTLDALIMDTNGRTSEDDLVELHPLSCVRRRQRWVLEQARLGPELKRLALREV